MTEVTWRSLVFGVDADGGVGLRTVVVLVAPAPQVVRPVARAVHSLLDDLLRHRLQIVRPAELSEEIDEVSSEVQPVVSQFRRFVVPREGVVVVVEALS